MEQPDRVGDRYHLELQHTQFLTAVEERGLITRYFQCAACGRRYARGYGAVPPRSDCAECGAPRDLEARRRLVEGALRFVAKVAREYAWKARGDQADSELVKRLVSAGNLGLLLAIERFKPSRGTRLLTYAAWWIRERIRSELSTMRTVRVPVYLQKQMRAKAVYDESLAECELPDDDHNKDGTTDVESDLVVLRSGELLHATYDAVGLSLRERYILILYTGSREDPKSLKQIAARLGGISPERVRQIKADALSRVRGHLRARGVRTASDLL